MKKIIKYGTLFCIMLAPLILSSCIDYVQAYSYKNGRYEIYHKMTISKIVTELAEGFSEESIEDPDYTTEIYENWPYVGTPEKVDNDLEEGFESRISIDPKTDDAKEKSLLPTKSGKKYFIPFTFGKTFSPDSIGASDEEASGLAGAFLSCAKCRILISKKIIPSIQSAKFEGINGYSGCTLPLHDYGDSFCVEIPVPLLFESNKYRLDRIVLEESTTDLN